MSSNWLEEQIPGGIKKVIYYLLNFEFKSKNLNKQIKLYNKKLFEKYKFHPGNKTFSTRTK